MRKLFATTAVLLALAGPALANSGQVPLAIKSLSASYPKCIQIVFPDDGTFTGGAIGGIIYMVSDQDMTSASILALADARHGQPLYFNSGAGAHAADCPPVDSSHVDIVGLTN